MSNSVRPYGLQPARVLCPCDSPGWNTGVGCYSLLQGICLIRDQTRVSYVYLHWQVGSFLLIPPGKPNYRTSHQSLDSKKINTILLTRLGKQQERTVQFFSISVSLLRALKPGHSALCFSWAEGLKLFVQNQLIVTNESRESGSNPMSHFLIQGSESLRKMRALSKFYNCKKIPGRPPTSSHHH